MQVEHLNIPDIMVLTPKGTVTGAVSFPRPITIKRLSRLG